MDSMLYKNLTESGETLQKVELIRLPLQDFNDQNKKPTKFVATVQPSTVNSIITAKFVGGSEPHLILNVSKEKLGHEKTSNLLRNLGFILVSIIAVIIVVVVVCLTVLKNDNGENTAASPSNQEETQVNFGNGLHIYTRVQWGGRPIQPDYLNRTLVHPTKLVIIGHTVTAQCMTLKACSLQLQAIQGHHVGTHNYSDIGYNFLVGGEGNIYQALGWDIQNYVRNNSIHISFTGNYIHDHVSDRQRMGVQALLKRGVALGKLDEDYLLVGHSQVSETLSPGAQLMAEIRLWPHYYNGSLP